MEPLWGAAVSHRATADDREQVEGTGGVNRLYAVLSKVNEAMVRVREPQALYEEACRIAVEDGLFLLAWIGFVEPGSEYIRPLARFGRDDGYLDDAKLSLNADVPEGRGPTGVALREGHAFINNDTENNPIMRPWRDEQLKRGFKSSASFPLITDGKTVGVITLYAGEVDYFDEEEVRLLKTLSDDFSFALESAARGEASRQLESTALLLEAAEQLSRSNRLDDVLERLADIVLRATSHSRVYIGLLAEDRSRVTFSPNLGQAALPSGTVVPWDGLSLSLQEVLTTGETRVVEYSQVPVGLRGIADAVNSRNALLAPILADGRVLGHIAVDDPEQSRVFTEAEIEIVEGIAHYAAAAIENARLFEAEVEAQRQASEQLARTTLLNAVTMAATTSSTVDEVASRFLDALGEGLGMTVGTVYSYERDKRTLALLAWCGVEVVSDRFRIVSVDDGSSLVAKAVREGVVVTTLDTALGEAQRETLAAAGLATSQSAAVPIEHKGEVLGAASFVFEREASFDSMDLDLFRSLGNIVGQALGNARLFDEVRNNARLSEALNVANAIVHSSLEIDQVMQHTLETGVSTLGCDAGAIETPEGDGWVVRYEAGFSPEVIGAHLSKRVAPNATQAAAQRAAYAIDDLSQDKKRNVGFVRRYALKSVLAVPLIATGDVIGCALFYAEKEVKHFTEAEIDFGRKLGSAASMALSNAASYGAERNIAHVLQDALLTLPSSVAGFEFASSYSSATVTTNVGGDFYDVFELDEHRVGVTMGDISGKGLDAAVLTSLLRNSIRAYATEPGHGPAKVLTQANSLFHRFTPTEIFATVFFGIVDRRDGRALYANAGHPAAALVREDGCVERLAGTGPLLGAFESAAYTDREVQLGREDLLFLYTDGLIEARRDGAQYGEERLFEFLPSSKNEPVSAVVEATMREIESFATAGLRDDLATLALRRSKNT
jgi:GAF domain-containing protein